MELRIPIPFWGEIILTIGALNIKSVLSFFEGARDQKQVLEEKDLKKLEELIGAVRMNRGVKEGERLLREAAERQKQEVV